MAAYTSDCEGTAVREPMIPNALKNLAQATERLSGRIDNLNNRLLLVSRSSIPTPECVSKMQRDQEESVPLKEGIDLLIHKVDSLTNYLDDIIGRLEV